MKAVAARLFAAAALLTAPAAVHAAAAPAPQAPYGPAITLEQAKVVIAAAEAEARRVGVQIGVAVAEPNGSLVAFERMTGASYNVIDNAPLKARSAAMWRRPTQAWVEASATSSAVSTFPNVIASPGGEVIVVGGQTIGAIGVSGSPPYELEIARIAAAALK